MASDETLQQLTEATSSSMEQAATFKSHKAFGLNTLEFTVCFAAWMLNGVLVTFLASNQVYD